jgi:hypothetical protein
MIYTFTDVFDNLEHEALKLLSPDDDVINYMKVAYNFVTDGRYDSAILPKLPPDFLLSPPSFHCPLELSTNAA